MDCSQLDLANVRLKADEASRAYLCDVLDISTDPSDTISEKFLTKTMEFLVS